MAGVIATGRFRRMIEWLGNAEPLSERVHRTLLATVYAQPLSLIIATLAGSIVTGVAA